jgi:hypothetical protein
VVLAHLVWGLSALSRVAPWGCKFRGSPEASSPLGDGLAFDVGLFVELAAGLGSRSGV